VIVLFGSTGDIGEQIQLVVARGELVGEGADGLDFAQIEANELRAPGKVGIE